MALAYCSHMKLPAICLASLLAVGVAAAAPAFAAQPVGAMHPEESIPDNLPPLASPGPEAEFIKQVQQKLLDHGFDAGTVNGQFGQKTQAALAQFQLSLLLPASGALDARTLLELGVERPQLD
jgi:peptidoglycan hydrolase-like protein with peptidoglycan-binding domain